MGNKYFDIVLCRFSENYNFQYAANSLHLAEKREASYIFSANDTWPNRDYIREKQLFEISKLQSRILYTDYCLKFHNAQEKQVALLSGCEIYNFSLPLKEII